MYYGDGNFLTSTSPVVTQVVNPLTATAVTLASTANPSTYGNPLTLTATATPASGGGTPTGTFTLWDGGVQVGAATPLDGNGQTTFTIVAPSGGNHSYSAAYSGDSNFAAAVSLALVLVTVAVGTSGCGGGNTSSGTASGSISTGTAAPDNVAPGTYHFTIEGKAGPTTIISQPLTLVVL